MVPFMEFSEAHLLGSNVNVAMHVGTLSRNDLSKNVPCLFQPDPSSREQDQVIVPNGSLHAILEAAAAAVALAALRAAALAAMRR
jgi:hypothetical protein